MLEEENAESTEFFPLRPPWPPVPKFFICVHLRYLRANDFLSEFAAVQQFRQLAA
jgi:hypothetical protein